MDLPRSKLPSLMKTDPLMTAPEVAKYFRVNIKTVRRWARAGMLNGIKLPSGKDWRFRTSVVKRAYREGFEGER